MKRSTMQPQTSEGATGTEFTTILDIPAGKGDLYGIRIYQEDASYSTTLKITIDGIEFEDATPLSDYPMVLASLCNYPSRYVLADGNPQIIDIPFSTSLKVEAKTVEGKTSTIGIIYGLET